MFTSCPEAINLKKGSESYRDRIYINDGKGSFSEDPKRIPEIRSSGSVVKPMDFNGDGFLDLFVGGRTPMGEYPIPEKSFLLMNEDGTLKDVTDSLAPGLRNVGMVTDAVWSDYNGDDQQDLIIVGEMMPITIFKNTNGSFEKFEAAELKNFTAWWESIATADMDNDGDMDFVVGNLGMNNLFQPSAEKPVTIIARDFDENGSIDPVSFAYFKNQKGEFKSYPINFWGDIIKQSPIFRSKFDYFKEYAAATDSMLLTSDERSEAMVLKGNFDKSSYVENLGNGTFKMYELPIEAQLAPLNDLLLTDIDGDGNKDVLAVGNDFGNETFIGRYDAFNGIILKGNGNGSFKAIPSRNSGFLATQDAKSITVVNRATGGAYYFVTQNKGKLLVFQK